MENNLAKMVATADLKLQGTYDRPQLFGHVEIDRGDIVFEGNRYVRHPRRHRLLQCGADRAGLRHRGRDPGARAGSDLQRHARLQRHDQPLLLHAELGSAAAEVDVVSLLLGQATDLTNAELRRAAARTRRSNRKRSCCGRRSRGC